MNDSFHPGRVDILGVGFDRLDMASLLVRVDADVSRGDRFTIAFSNPEFLMESRRSPLVRRYLSTVRYNLADGIGAVWAARRFGDALPERVTGTDFTLELAALCARRGHSLYLLGGAPGIAEEAARRLRARHPGLIISGTHHGFFDDDGPVLADINRARPTFLMVCLGNPKQEAWIERNFARLDVQVAFGNGGALDFHSGRVRRAPPWMMRLSLEWLHRLGQDLSWRRFKRQMRLVSFVALVMSNRFGVVVPSRRKAD